MKKLLCLCLVLFLLCGCGKAAKSDETGNTEPTVETEYMGTYEKESPIEKETAGAVRLYRPGGQQYTRVATMASQLLLISEGEETRLELFQGEDCIPAAGTYLPMDLSLTQWQVTDTGFFCYDRENRFVLCLDSSLNTVRTIPMPEEMTGEPILSDSGKEIFYCRGQQLRSVELSQGIDRLIRQLECDSADVLGSYFAGSVVCCRVTVGDNRQEIYISGENGSILAENTGIQSLAAAGDRFYTHRYDGVTGQYLCGKKGGAVLELSIPETVVPALEMGMLVGISAGETGTVLSCYSADTGKKTAQVTLGGHKAPLDILADSRSQCLWLVMEEGVLLQWKPEASPAADNNTHAVPLHNAQNPDTAALEALQNRVDGLNQELGVQIRIWQDAVRTPGRYTLEAEYQPTAISEMLDELEAQLRKLPEDFLKKSVSSGLRICIVRSVDGKPAAVQYWDENDAFIALSCGNDVEYEFFKAFAYVVDVHILGNSPMVDTWEQLNPEGFVYGAAGEPGDAFTDPEAMQSVTDDRAYVFLRAVMSDNGQLFASETMQSKLRTLCKAIRDAWGWEKKSEVYLWEQYLQESIAYQK